MSTEDKATEYRVIDLCLDNGSDLKLLIYHAYWRTFLRVLRTQGIPFEDVTGESLDAEPLDEVDVLLTWKCPDSVLGSLTNLKWIQTTSAGVDQLLHFYRSMPDLIVTTAKGIAAEPISSYVLLMILAFQWDIQGILERQQRHLWELHRVELISESTCAVIGLGNVGRLVAKRAKQLGMTVVGAKRTPEPVDHVDRVFASEQLHEMLAAADFVVLALPLTDETRGMFGEAEFGAMKTSAYLIQVSRGGIVDEDALLDALENGEIAGSAIDVFEQEPLPAEHPLWEAPNAIITPHQAAERTDYLETVGKIFVNNVTAYPETAEMQGLASAEKGY